jgi:transcription initiation factor IIE alpha subunit
MPRLIRVCNRCGHKVHKCSYHSENKYKYTCPECDEDLYGIETHLIEAPSAK